MYKSSAFVLLLCSAELSFGAQAILIGQGQVFSAADYVELTIVVDSKCYPTPAEARKFNDEATRKIVDFLNTKIKKTDLYNNVVATGGYTSSYQTYYQDKYWCQNTFQKQTTIIFKTQDLNTFEGLFNDIQNKIYQQFSRTAPTVIETAISYVTMTDPAPGVTDELRTQLENQALALAFKDAKAKLMSLFPKNFIQNLKMTYASELPPDEAKPVFQAGAAPMAMMNARMEKRAERAPVQFDAQNIIKTMYFTFVFDDMPLATDH